MTVYNISQYFDSIQGEGQDLGRVATFIRLAGCNLGKDCNIDCDTKYSWKTTRTMTLEEVVSKCFQSYVVITGGEPLLQDIAPLILQLLQRGKHVALETNGTLYRSLPRPVLVTVSPKRPLETDLETVMHLAQDNTVQLKFVCGAKLTDLQNVDNWVAAWSKRSSNVPSVVIQPLDNDETTARWLAERLVACQSNYRLMPQYHKTLWHGDINK